MSLLDQVRTLEQQVIDRLRELEPLSFEYDQLRKVAERLGVKYTPTAAEAAGEGEPATPQGTRRPGRGRAAAKGTAKPRAKRSTTARRSTAATATGGSGGSAPLPPRTWAAKSAKADLPEPYGPVRDHAREGESPRSAVASRLRTSWPDGVRM